MELSIGTRRGLDISDPLKDYFFHICDWEGSRRHQLRLNRCCILVPVSVLKNWRKDPASMDKEFTNRGPKIFQLLRREVAGDTCLVSSTLCSMGRPFL